MSALLDAQQVSPLATPGSLQTPEFKPMDYNAFMALPLEERLSIDTRRIPQEITGLWSHQLNKLLKSGVRVSADKSVFRMPAPGMASGTVWEGAIDGPPQRYLVKKLIPHTGVALLSGASGAGKSFVAIDLAGSLATGRPFFDKKVTKGGTLFLASEAAGTFGDRLKAYRRGKLDPDFLEAAFDGLPPPYAETFPIAVTAIDSITISNFDDLMDYIEYIDTEMLDRFDVPLRLVVIDTFAAAFGLEDENSSTEVTAAMKLLQRMAAQKGIVVMPVVHHGKSETGGVRGSSAFEASADVRLTVHYTKNTEGEVAGRNISLGKSRYDETGWCHEFSLGQHSFGADEDGDEITSCYVIDLGEPEEKSSKAKKNPKGKHRETLLAAIDQAVSEDGKPGDEGWVPTNDVRAFFAAIDGKDAGSDAFRKQCERTENDAEEAGEIELSGARGARKMRRTPIPDGVNESTTWNPQKTERNAR